MRKKRKKKKKKKKITIFQQQKNSEAGQKNCSPSSLNVSILAIGCYESLVGHLEIQTQENLQTILNFYVTQLVLLL